MIPSDIRKQIFRSLPVRIIIGDIPYPAARSYSDNAPVQTLLQQYPLVVTLRYSADRPAREWIPATRLLAVGTAENTLTYQHGQWRHATLTLDVHARDTDTAAKAELVETYLDTLQLWALRDLPELITVADDLGTLDLSYIDPDIARREIAFTLRYLQSYLTETPATKQIDAPDLTLEP
jgi:hypothetical protein